MPLAVSIARVARRTLDVLLLLLIGLVVVTMVIARVIPAVTGGATFVVGGGSMEPTIPLGSAVVTAPVAATDLAVGDIVSLRVGDQHAVFTHRIIRLAERDGAVWLETRGDANTAPDPSLVPATEVIGRVTLSIPLAGYLVMVLGSVQGMLFLVSLGVLVLAGAWMLETFEDDRAESMRRRTRDGFGLLLTEPATEQGAPG
jgi:signal peptidase